MAQRKIAGVICIRLLQTGLRQALLAVCQASLRTNEGITQMVYYAGSVYDIEGG